MVEKKERKKDRSIGLFLKSRKRRNVVERQRVKRVRKRNNVAEKLKGKGERKRNTVVGKRKGKKHT